MKKISFVMAAFAAVLFVGCATTTTQIYDPADGGPGLRNSRNISSEEMRIIARESVASAMTNPKFKSFLRKYQNEKGDPDAIPVLKLVACVNDTNDPDLNTDEITDFINTELLNAGLVDVTLAEGEDRTSAIADSRDLEYDDNFDQSTVAERGTLQAARLIMRPKVISNETREGNRKDVVRSFVMDMADIKTGLIVWRYSKQLGFVQKRSAFGM